MRPVLEYSSTVWDPHLSPNIHSLEQVQRRAARCVHRNYTERTPGCVTNMAQSLGWESLQHRRYLDRLSMLFRIQQGLVDMNTDVIQHSQRLRQLPASKDVFKYSFYPCTISDWNRLPTSVTNIQTLQGFREGIANLSFRIRNVYGWHFRTTIIHQNYGQGD